MQSGFFSYVQPSYSQWSARRGDRVAPPSFHNLDNDQTKFKLSFSVDGEELLNFSSNNPVTNSGNTFSDTDYFIIGLISTSQILFPVRVLINH